MLYLPIHLSCLLSRRCAQLSTRVGARGMTVPPQRHRTFLRSTRAGRGPLPSALLATSPAWSECTEQSPARGALGSVAASGASSLEVCTPYRHIARTVRSHGVPPGSHSSKSLLGPPLRARYISYALLRSCSTRARRFLLVPIRLLGSCPHS